jgi:hypothetical protein
VALQYLKDLGRLTCNFLDLFRHMVGLLGRVISPSQGLYLHRTTQNRKTRTNIHALSGIWTHDPSNQPAKTHASDRTATVTGLPVTAFSNFCIWSFWVSSTHICIPTVFTRIYIQLSKGKSSRANLKFSLIAYVSRTLRTSIFSIGHRVQIKY